jgi:LPS-assembly protein
LAIAAALVCAGAWAQADSGAAPTDPGPTAAAPAAAAGTASGAASAPASRLIILRADEFSVRPDLDAEAIGHVDLRYSGTRIEADRLSYDSAADLARARGNVSVTRSGNRYSGPELQLTVDRFEGWFTKPRYEFGRIGAGGRAERIDFIDSSRLNAENAIYTGCPRDDANTPDWMLTTDRVKLDLETNEAVAEGAVLRFLGVPILGAPSFSFPLTDDRLSGWLPPTVGLDNRSGFEFGVPYYWNIAPNRDATFTPTLLSRRGASLDAEFRYLELDHHGRVDLDLLPNDRVAGRSRYALQLVHQGLFGNGWHYDANWLRVSDDAYWRDFPRALPVLTPRLLPRDLQFDRVTPWLSGELTTYFRVQRWQVLQTTDPTTAIAAPYERSPQIGARLVSVATSGLRWSLETEVNHFTQPAGSATLPTGWRWHALGQLSRPWETPGSWITPKLTLNTAAYALDSTAVGAQRRSRTIPTASVDAGLIFERDLKLFGRDLRQTLEPRLLYVNTPYVDQSGIPQFDSAGRDFNVSSIYSENTFSGIDRVSDAHQITVGATTRLLADASGAELLRLGLAQRFLLRSQRITPEGVPFTQRFSDLLLEGRSTLSQAWTLEASTQYNPDTHRSMRSIIGTRYSPGPFRTVSLNYRLAFGLSEQIELGWQWPIYKGSARPVGAANGCGGTLYGVGRANYSTRDSRVTDSILGLEYDAGCWIGRVVSERLSTSGRDSTTRLLLQLELTGLSRLGSNPLQVLKDNIPGYRLLRDPRATPPSTIDHD